MRPVICALSILFCGIGPALRGADLTVILSFEAGHSERSDAAMRLEAEKLLNDSGVTLDWRLLNRLSPGESFSKLAVVKLKGQCEMASLLPRLPEASASLGITYRVDGRIIPFSQVDCDEVRATLGGTRLPVSAAARDQIYGRALGRVLAHELFHVLKRTGQHAKEGVTQKYFTAARLVDDEID